MPVPFITFDHVSFRKFGYSVFPDTNWKLCPGENWAVIGPNGSGKTTFLEALEGCLLKVHGQIDYHITDANGHLIADPHKSIASVYFNDRTVNYGDFYYQQRYHATETDGIVKVRDFLHLSSGEHIPELENLDMTRLLDMEIIKLSNGQFKKMLIIKALLKRPKLLLLDNLYTGLDVQARAYVSGMLKQITDMGTQIIMVTDSDHIPGIITHVMKIEQFSITGTFPIKKFIAEKTSAPNILLPTFPPLPETNFKTAVQFDEVTIKYNDRTIIDHVNWKITQGEKWALMGPNGAGKSMLLSLIFADNPQAYANKITLFDRKRGTGESIWDIKEKIGFVSPEMHVYFRQQKTCREISLSGLTENPYGNRKIPESSVRFSEELFSFFSIRHIENEYFQRISTGQQNMVLLIRALVKNPPMLILDEPFQGVDMEKVRLSNLLLNSYSRQRTMIFVSHNPSELPSCIDHCLYIENGKAFEKPGFPC
ncbi:MAG: ATP-binding cassette domain-containing protein [Bacteroidales bacterium]|nr:ATP-binding cassette domain-containing protein [Bacteroidales bacterium]